ncbi:unnamed protein product, partial [Discosporangium mesarthrocarpum]
DSVRLDGPYGVCRVPFRAYDTVVMFAGGIGVTPMLSIVRDILHVVKS